MGFKMKGSAFKLGNVATKSALKQGKSPLKIVPSFKTQQRGFKPEYYKYGSSTGDHSMEEYNPDTKVIGSGYEKKYLEAMKNTPGMTAEEFAKKFPTPADYYDSWGDDAPADIKQFQTKNIMTERVTDDSGKDVQISYDQAMANVMRDIKTGKPIDLTAYFSGDELKAAMNELSASGDIKEETKKNILGRVGEYGSDPYYWGSGEKDDGSVIKKDVTPDELKDMKTATMTYFKKINPNLSQSEYENMYSEYLEDTKARAGGDVSNLSKFVTEDSKGALENWIKQKYPRGSGTFGLKDEDIKSLVSGRTLKEGN